MMSDSLESRLKRFRRFHPNAARAFSTTSLALNDTRLPLRAPEAILADIQRLWSEGHDLIFIKGIGDGEWLERITKPLLAALNPNRGLVIIEPHTARLLHALDRFSFEAILESQYIFWCLGVDWSAEWESLDRKWYLGGCANPASISIYAGLAEECYERIDAALQETLLGHLDRLSQTFGEAMKDYDARDGAIRKIWLLTNELSYATAFVLDGLAEGFRSHGLDVCVCHVPANQYISPRGGNWSLLEYRPDLVVTANVPLHFNVGALADALPIPQVVWFTDAPILDLAQPRISPQNIICCFDRHYIPALAQRLEKPVYPLQGAAYNWSVVEPDPDLQCQVSVVASVRPIEPILNPFSRADRDYLLQLSEAKADDRRLDLEETVQNNPPPDSLQRLATMQVAGYAYLIANSIYRRRGVERLLKFNLSLWGSEAWLEGEPENSPIRQAYRGFIRDNHKLAAVYQSSEIHVSLHSVGSVHGLNMHAWNVPTQKTFLLMENLPGVADCFEPGTEIACYDSFEALPDTVDRWLADPAGRIEIAEAGYARVKRDHTFKNRARQLLDIVVANPVLQSR